MAIFITGAHWRQIVPSDEVDRCCDAVIRAIAEAEQPRLRGGVLRRRLREMGVRANEARVGVTELIRDGRIVADVFYPVPGLPPRDDYPELWTRHPLAEAGGEEREPDFEQIDGVHVCVAPVDAQTLLASMPAIRLEQLIIRLSADCDLEPPTLSSKVAGALSTLLGAGR